MSIPLEGTVGGCHEVPEHGMALRDWFAGQALSGIMANAQLLAMMHKEASPQGLASEEVVAAAAYSFADAMLKARGSEDG